MSLKILQRKSVPSFTLTGDGFPGDPVNLVLMGEFSKLRAAFLAAGWTEAAPLDLKVAPGAWPYVRAQPALPRRAVQHALFVGRGQDIGFQKAIDMSPRNSSRPWALSLERDDPDAEQSGLRLNADRRPVAPRSGSAPERGTRGSPSPNSPSVHPRPRTM